jgi:Outer membrane protein beta-barrel domain
VRLALMSMRKQLLLILFLVSQTALAQKHEIGLTLGGLFPQDRGAAPDAVRLGGGTALQANYGYRFFGGQAAALYGEVHFLANPQRDITSANQASGRDVATIYVTPGIRVKFASGRFLSPYVAVGGGYAVYEQSLLTIGGAHNPAPRDVHRGAFDFGGGVDTKLWRWIALRGEIRDFYSGTPAYNLSGLGGGQHNVVAGGGFVLKWGE